VAFFDNNIFKGHGLVVNDGLAQYFIIILKNDCLHYWLRLHPSALLPQQPSPYAHLSAITAIEERL
jgi:hypothetical protein